MAEIKNATDKSITNVKDSVTVKSKTDRGRLASAAVRPTAI